MSTATKKRPATKAVKKTTASKKATPKKTAKTTAKKATAKIPSAKKTATKKTAKRPSAAKAKKVPAAPTLVVAAGPEAFWMNDGTILHTLRDLEQAFDRMEDVIFGHHVAPDKNDFADWVELVLADRACASSLRGCTTPQGARKVVTKHLKVYVL